MRRVGSVGRPGVAVGLVCMQVTLGVVAGGGIPAGAAPLSARQFVPGETQRVSVSAAGVQGNGPSRGMPAVSADGSVVVFVSAASNLVPGDTNGVADVFVRSLSTGTTARVSVPDAATNHGQADGTSSGGSISADNRYVAFQSEAANLVAGDTNGVADVFVHDLLTRTTVRVSVSDAGEQADRASTVGSISANGRFVTFDTTAANLVEGDTNGLPDVFVHDRVTRKTVRVNVSDSGGQATGGASSGGRLSADGSRVAFVSDADNLVSGDTNDWRDVFVHDRTTGRTIRVSRSQREGERSGFGGHALSADGRHVAYTSPDVADVGDTNGLEDVFVYDFDTASTTRVSVSTGGHLATGPWPGSVLQSVNPSLSADGRYVAFDSYARNLVPGDDNVQRDVFVHDRRSGRTVRASVSSSGAEARSASSAPGGKALSADGQTVVFGSIADDLVPGDTNQVTDDFVHRVDFTPASTLTLSGGRSHYRTGEKTTLMVHQHPQRGWSGDHRWFVQLTGTSTYVPIAGARGSRYTFTATRDLDGAKIIARTYRRDLALAESAPHIVWLRGSGLRQGPTTRATLRTDGTQGNGVSQNPAISADGRYVAFESSSTNLVPGRDVNRRSDVFLHDRQTGKTTRISNSRHGNRPANDASRGPSLSADGRFVAFSSLASDLVPGDTNGAYDVFVHDRRTGRTTRVNVSEHGEQGNGESYFAHLSSSGRYLSFWSDASNLVPGDTNGLTDVFWRDLHTGKTTRVNVGDAGQQADGLALNNDIDGTGRCVVFSSSATNLVPGDTNGQADVFVRDMRTATTTRINLTADGQQADRGSGTVHISDGCRYVSFESDASNLVPGDTNETSDVFVHDRATGTTVRATATSTGGQLGGGGVLHDLSPDGRHVVFLSADSNLPHANGTLGVFVRDSVKGDTTRVDVSANQRPADSDSRNYFPALSADGRYVTFLSESTNLVPDDTNGVVDIFVHDRRDDPRTGTTARTDGTPSLTTRRSVAPVQSASTATVKTSSAGGNAAGTRR